MQARAAAVRLAFAAQPTPGKFPHDHESAATAAPGRSHPQLARDTVDRRPAFARVLVVNDANWPWLLLVPRRVGTREIIDLDEVEQAQLMTKSRRRRAVKAVTDATSSTSRRSAMSCRNSTSTSSPAARRCRLAAPGLGRGPPVAYEKSGLSN